MTTHLASWTAFEQAQDARFTEAALLDYRRSHIGNFLNMNTSKTGRCSVVAAGAAEYGFYRHLYRIFSDRIHRRFVVQLGGRSYHPDFVFFDPVTRLRIDIEPDELYGLHDRLPIHFVDPNGSEGQPVAVNIGRDEVFSAGWWVVVRFAEAQVVTDPAGCCRVIAEVVSRITGKWFTALADTLPIGPVPQWTRDQANVWAEFDYRKPFIKQAERETAQPLAVAQWTFVPSPHQQAIFDFLTDGQGYGLVTAVAGSGKSTTLLEATRVIRSRDAHIRILLLAFNRSIRDELVARINASEIDSVELARTLMSGIEAAVGAKAGLVQVLRWSNIAIHVREGDLLLARKNATVQCAVLALIARGHTINYAAASSGVSAVLAALKLLREAAHIDPNPLSVPPRQAWEKDDPVRKMLPRILECLQHAAVGWGGDFYEFVAYRTQPDPRFGVTVCSAHQAKGLEAEHVFILGESAFGNSHPEQPAWEREKN